MHRRLSDYIDRNKLFTKTDHLLVAVSGGVDSVVLVHLMHEEKYNFSIAHCNFQLRGEASERDENFVKELAASFKRHIYVKAFDTQKFASTRGISIQMAARELRREWFDELMKTEGFHCIVTAHHLNDSLETVLFNLTKGTGIAGLSGIQTIKGNYTRPLMFSTRAMILEYAHTHHLIWREDASNATIKYHRNLLRHQVVPVLRQINPSVDSSFRETLERISATSTIYLAAIEKWRQQLLQSDDKGLRISISSLSKVPESKQVLYEILAPFGFNYSQASNVMLAINAQAGKRFFSMEHMLLVDREFLFLQKNDTPPDIEVAVNKDDTYVEFLGQEYVCESIPTDTFHVENDPQQALLNMEKLQFPLKVRRWKPGDKFQPLGMKGKKKLSDFMIDLKIPVTLKTHMTVFLSGEDIVWVAGYRIDERYKITSATRHVFRIKKQ